MYDDRPHVGGRAHTSIMPLPSPRRASPMAVHVPFTSCSPPATTRCGGGKSRPRSSTARPARCSLRRMAIRGRRGKATPPAPSPDPSPPSRGGPILHLDSEQMLRRRHCDGTRRRGPRRDRPSSRWPTDSMSAASSTANSLRRAGPFRHLRSTVRWRRPVPPPSLRTHSRGDPGRDC